MEQEHTSKQTTGQSKPKKSDGFEKELRQEFKKAKELYAKRETQVDHKEFLRQMALVVAGAKERASKALKKEVYEFARSRKVLGVSESYELNSLEADEIEDKCRCVSKIGAAGLHVELGDVIKFKKDWDESRTCDVYTIYPVRRIDPNEQITDRLAWKIQQGFVPQEEDFLPEKHVVHRFALRESEFSKYFEEV